MGPLRSFVVALVVVTMLPGELPARAETVADWRPYIVEASTRFGIPVAWIEHVMRAESGGRTSWRGRPITSRAGAIGLMQLMPATWADLRSAYRLGTDPHDPHDNIVAGTAYLRLMYDRFGYPGLFAAYNAGPGRYAEYLGGRPLPAETRAYLDTVTAGRLPADRLPRTASSAASNKRLFATVGGMATEASPPIATPPPDGLFAVPPRS